MSNWYNKNVSILKLLEIISRFQYFSYISKMLLFTLFTPKRNSRVERGGWKNAFVPKIQPKRKENDINTRITLLSKIVTTWNSKPADVCSGGFELEILSKTVDRCNEWKRKIDVVVSEKKRKKKFTAGERREV